MSRSKSVSKPQIIKAELEVFTKEQFNFKRNNSHLMSTCLSWDWMDQDEDYIEEPNYGQNHSTSPPGRDYETRNQQGQQHTHPQSARQPPGAQQQQRAKTAQHKSKSLAKNGPQRDYSKFQKTEEQILEQKRKQLQRREKIKSYFESLVPYTRTLTDSKFQHFYQKSPPQMYGANNINQPNGGTIYGNNYKTFNVNPHSYQSNPKNYQSHTTALNFAFRTKRDEQKHWKLLQKQLSKKLNLRETNHSIQEGKQVVYVDVNDKDMHSVMRQNSQFKKKHDDQIIASQKKYEFQKRMQQNAEKQKFYKNKAESLQKNLKTAKSTEFSVDRDQKGRVREQVIYKHHDKDGNVRIGADRHALTCFVDLNFPQNDAIYTAQLKKRYSIYPDEVQSRIVSLF